MTTRYIELDNQELKDLVIKKGEIVAKGREHYKKMAEFNTIGNEISEERNAIVDEIVELTEKLMKDEKLEEFELAASTEMKDDTVRVSVVDRVALFKEQLRNEASKAERKEAGTQTEDEILLEKVQSVNDIINNMSKEDLAEKIDAIVEIVS
jgi:undecaprenyl pyrophosphate synthase